MKLRLLFGVTVVAACLAGLTPQKSRAENWAHWRGPFFNGSTSETNLPVNWSTTENIAWTAPLPGLSGATPIIWGDHVFVSSPDADKNLCLFCFNRKDGKSLWQKTVAVGDRTKGRNNMASPSPVTDGKRVFVIYGTGDLGAYDFDGKELWKRNLGKEYGRFSDQWLYGSSPLLFEDRLYIQVLQRNPRPDDYTSAIDSKPERESYLLCLNPATGKNIWRHVRLTDAKAEAQEAYSSPIPDTSAHPPEIIIVGGNYTTAHNPKTGEELWRCGGLNAHDNTTWRIVPSPLVADGIIISCAPKHEPVFGIRDGGKGLVTDTAIAWTFTQYPSDCVTPLYYKGKVFVLDGDKQVMTCLDPKTGETKWQGKLGVREIFRASPTAADDKIYCISENGTVVVLSAGDEFKVLSTISMGGEPVRSCIAVSHGQLFIRTADTLYCVGKK
ncbi:MAG TPA: PQQ-binding-like beta-propeller repeat protein [Verrucomicrobiae bacterium]|nr:PQQ-binding-like beta-propeller repeat protein [Verrucomicrobiae bacterium]